MSKHPPAGAPGFCDDSAVRVRRAELNRVNGRAVGAPIFVDVTKGLSLCHIVVSLLMLGAPGGGGGAGVLLEGLGEGGLLGIIEPLCNLRYRERAIGQKVLCSLHTASADVGAQGLASLGLKGAHSLERLV